MSESELVVEQRASRQTSSAVMAMVIFVASEAMFFMAFFGVYASTYSNEPVWPPKDVPLLSLGLPTAAVAVLLVSGAPMPLAARAVGRGRVPSAPRWLGLTA